MYGLWLTKFGYVDNLLRKQTCSEVLSKEKQPWRLGRRRRALHHGALSRGAMLSTSGDSGLTPDVLRHLTETKPEVGLEVSSMAPCPKAPCVRTRRPV